MQSSVDGSNRYNPWVDAARRWPGWTIGHAGLGGRLEAVWPRRRLFYVDTTTNPRHLERRIAHAIAHLDLGHHNQVRESFTGDMEQAATDLARARLKGELDPFLFAWDEMEAVP